MISEKAGSYEPANACNQYKCTPIEDVRILEGHLINIEKSTAYVQVKLSCKIKPSSSFLIKKYGTYDFMFLTEHEKQLDTDEVHS